MGWEILPEPEYVDDPLRMLQVCRHIRDTGISGLDTETTGLNLARDHILFWSLAPDLRTRYCLSRQMLPILKRELGDDPDITWIMTNANYDNNMLANSGVPLLAGKIYCTLVEDWLHNENELHGLKETAKRHLGLKMREFKKVFVKKRGETYQDTLLRMMDQQPGEAIDYASMDAWASLALHMKLAPVLARIPTSTGLTMWDLFENIEAPYTKVLYNCIRRGIMVDVGWLKEIREPITADMEEIQFKFNRIAGEEVNLNSPLQLREIFINRLGYKPIKYTSGGASGNRQPSVDESVLKRWAEEGDELAGLVMKFRGLAKTRGTYVDGMIERCDPHLRIHPMLTQSVTVTGRLSSRDPNLQNIPRPDDDVYGLRSAFMPDTGYTLVASDYAQLEMRLLAQMSDDKNMQKVILDGKDIHMGTASLMYGVPYEEIAEAKKEAGRLEKAEVPFDQWPARIRELMGYRQDAKAIGFGQHRGRSKTCSKRGNLSAEHKAIPCCAARRSVSTCDRRRTIPNVPPVSIGQGSQSRLGALTRQANCIRFGIWQRIKRSYVWIAERRHGERETAKNGVPNAVRPITSRGVESDGIIHTSRRGMLRPAPKTTTGRAVDLQSTTKRSPTRCTVVCVPAAALREYSYITRMESKAIPSQKIWKSSASVATKLMCMTARQTYRTSSRRYSQCRWKQRSNTINYGKGDRALADDLGITQEEAAERKAKYFEPYPDVRKFIEFTHNYCREFAEVSTILGRKRRLPDANHDWRDGFYSRKERRWVPERPGPIAARALRQDVNSIIQGSAADVARMAQIECEESERLQELGVRQILQIHDEILFEVPTEYLEESCQVIRDVMEHPFRNLPERLGLEFRELAIPLDVDVGYGEAWSEAH